MTDQEANEKLANMLNRNGTFHINSKNEMVVSISSHIHIFSMDEVKEIVKELENIVIKKKLGVPPTIIEKIMFYIFSRNSI